VGGGADALARLVADELAGPCPEPAARLAEAIRRRTGAATAAILFYGSCLRKRTAEGVFDFYVIVDGYREASPGRLLAWANAWIPPNVFYLELDAPGGVLRAKYAVVSQRDFARGAAGAWLRSGIWARFCQPARAVYLRDADAQRAAVAACVASLLTALERGLALVPADGARIRVGAEALWQAAFAETYAAELRPEAPGAVRALFADAPERYAQAMVHGAALLEARGRLRVVQPGDPLEVEIAPARRRQQRRALRLRRPLAKLAYAVQLLKSTFTFGDWLPYVLWKLERHSGMKLVASERQRRHPLLWGWPLLFRALRERALR
jgi:hypothetical protein